MTPVTLSLLPMVFMSIYVPPSLVDNSWAPAFLTFGGQFKLVLSDFSGSLTHPLLKGRKFCNQEEKCNNLFAWISNAIINISKEVISLSIG